MQIRRYDPRIPWRSPTMRAPMCRHRRDACVHARAPIRRPMQAALYLPSYRTTQRRGKHPFWACKLSRSSGTHASSRWCAWAWGALKQRVRQKTRTASALPAASRRRPAACGLRAFAYACTADRPTKATQTRAKSLARSRLTWPSTHRASPVPQGATRGASRDSFFWITARAMHYYG